MQSNYTVETILNKIKSCLWGIFIADAFTMPAHYYYDLKALKKDFNYLSSYAKPKLKHPDSRMTLPKTDDPTQDLIGKHILHSKRDLYNKGMNSHYHHGLEAGENTLNALITKLAL